VSTETLCVIWFLLEGVLLTGYAILDGFDLGVGILHPFVAKTNRERRVSMNSIGPVWDGNEVWLVTFGGALFAAFPEAYATVFSGFYTAFMLLLFSLIFRAVSLEFRSKFESLRWRAFWDWGFFASSTTAVLLFGVAVGNAMIGMALDGQGNFHGSVLDQLGPYPLLVGLMSISLLAMHGGLFLRLKTEGEMRQRLSRVLWPVWAVFLVLFVITTVVTLWAIPRATANFTSYPVAGVAVLAMVAAVANIPRCMKKELPGQAFLSSCVVVTALVALFGFALFPNLVTASNDPANHVTIYSAASSPKTLNIMLIIAAIGMPFVLMYSALIYWTFRGKVKLSDHSY
jgi:cytochrome bd ubiquinol oxidase subunit II